MTSKNNRGYMSGVDELVEQTPLDLVLSHYGLPPTGGGNEYRMKCVFNEACSDSQYGNLSVKLDAAKRIYTHCCGVKGNLLTLLHGLETHQPPTGGRLRGQEFKEAVVKLKEINGVVESPSQSQTSGKRVWAKSLHRREESGCRACEATKTKNTKKRLKKRRHLSTSMCRCGGMRKMRPVR
jgi:hypothetical protein